MVSEDLEFDGSVLLQTLRDYKSSFLRVGNKGPVQGFVF